jgi:hypothetical protein
MRQKSKKMIVLAKRTEEVIENKGSGLKNEPKTN